MPAITAAKPRLEASLVELKGRLASIAQDLSGPADPDWDDMAIEQEDDEALEHQAALVEREIVSINRALARIESGTYGTCIGCGVDIDPARLQARPEAALCINCARTGSAAPEPSPTRSRQTIVSGR